MSVRDRKPPLYSILKSPLLIATDLKIKEHANESSSVVKTMQRDVSKK
jgi:hypothetical protein